jgi:AhpD family alkylhydroperoxidase
MTETIAEIKPRMQNPAVLLPGANDAIQALIQSTRKGGVPHETLELVHLRVSQINGCSFCVDAGWQGAQKRSEEGARKLFAVAAWREAPFFTEAERAALTLAEAVTRLSDRADPVSDEIWDEAARHFDESQLAALVLWIATTNVFNRVNVSVRQPAGSWSQPAE